VTSAHEHAAARPISGRTRPARRTSRPALAGRSAHPAHRSTSSSEVVETEPLRVEEADGEPLQIGAEAVLAT